jgi:SAM-dependent methyltransferase
MVQPSTHALPEVLAFYKELPFNYHESAGAQANMIRARDSVAIYYPVLLPFLQAGSTVLELGCGAGWLSLSLRLHHRCEVTGIDFNPVVVGRAREMAKLLRQTVKFEVADLFLYEPKEPVDLGISLGVLHHTGDCKVAVERICNRFVSPKGHVFIGLYHEPGRRPFLNHFEHMKKNGSSEEAMFAEYRRLHSELKDEVLARSWFRDQVLHPHETQHTLAEMMPVLNDCGMELCATSINGFKPIANVSDVLSLEDAFRLEGERALARGEYYPGFFVFLARRKKSPQLGGVI